MNQEELRELTEAVSSAATEVREEQVAEKIKEAGL